jgi:hypothetical protein
MQTNQSSLPVISMSKFTLLYFATAGFYSLYWFYRCWVGAEKITGRSYFKFGRAAFAVLFVYELFQLLFNEERRRQSDYPWKPTRLAWIFIGAAIAQVFLTYGVDRLELGAWGRLSVFVLVLVVQFYSLYQAQLAINRIEGDPFGKANQSLNLFNHIWIMVGLYIWIKLISNAIYPPTVPPATQPPGSMPAPSAVR